MKTIKNYVSLFILFLICKEVFHINFNDYADIKYFFPQRTIYIVFSLLVNYFYLKIYDICILGLIGAVFIEIVVGLCMSLFYKRLGSHTFMITFILIVFTKYLITLASGIMS